MRFSTILLSAALLWGSAASHTAARELQFSRHNPDEPIEVTADHLEVRQREGLARFRGSVRALQGELQLTAEEMIIHYATNPEEKTTDPGGRIQKIDAKGDVELTTDDESVAGDFGTYYVTRGMVEMENDVVLSKAGNVIEGQKLVYNLKTGKSKITAGEAEDGNTGKPARVRGVFLPGSVDE